MSQHFDIERLTNLLRTDFINRYRSVGIASAALTGLVFIIAMFNAPETSGSTGIYSILLFCMLLIWGPIAASHSFRELHDKEMNQAYLLLPASALEKMISRLLLVIVVFPLYAVVFVMALSWLMIGVQSLLGTNSWGAFVPSEFLQPISIGTFVVNQSLFFLGAAWFRKMHLIKTVLSLTGLGIGMSIFAGVVLRTVFPDVMSGDFDFDPAVLFENHEGLTNVLLFVLRLLYYAVLPTFCWSVAWLRIRETQVSHGV